jgi:hypothetical protein
VKARMARVVNDAFNTRQHCCALLRRLVFEPLLELRVQPDSRQLPLVVAQQPADSVSTAVELKRITGRSSGGGLLLTFAPATRPEEQLVLRDRRWHDHAGGIAST